MKPAGEFVSGLHKLLAPSFPKKKKKGSFNFFGNTPVLVPDFFVIEVMNPIYSS